MSNATELYALNLVEVTALIRNAKDTTVLVQGHMGTGKSSILKILADEMPDHVPCYFDCTTKDLGDITIPKIQALDADSTAYVQYVTNEERDQYHMSFVSDVKRATKVALSKLTPYSAKEMAALSILQFREDVSAARGKVMGALMSVVSPIQSANVLRTELKGLMAQGVRFTTPEFVRAAECIVAAEQQWEAVHDKPLHGYYVYVRMVGDQQWVDVLDGLDMQTRSVDVFQQTSFPATDLPEDIQGKIAVLSMATIDQYMQGVGRRVSDKAFWLER